MAERPQVRAVAAKVVNQVLQHGCSLRQVLGKQSDMLLAQDQKLLKALCFGTLRLLPRLEWYLKQLMETLLVKKEPLLHALLLIGCYQLSHSRIPPYAAIYETVEGAVTLKKSSFKALINGVLRQFLRKKEHLCCHSELPESCRYLHPTWMVERLRQIYPQQWQQIIVENNRHPPLWLRVNRNFISRTDYLHCLTAAGLQGTPHPQQEAAIQLLTPVPVADLPGFFSGWISVQDVAAQLCVDLLEPQNGELILDLCAAPGGKTTHILERAPRAKVWALDHNQERLSQVASNLQRLNQQAKLICADANQPELWCHLGMLFDRIVVDVPCSATGVIRRHPDIKWLRRSMDIPALVEQQQAILQAIWPYLKPQGVLIYVTCSVLPEENSQQIALFLEKTPTAQLLPIGEESGLGWQLLPQIDGGDGFFYAKLMKQA